MRLTTKGRYAVTAVLDLAFHQEQGPVSLADISQRQGISLSYLEQLFSRLRRNNVVSSTRGPGGGYSLARDEEDISMAQIIVAVDESYDATSCGGEGTCSNDSYQCLTHDLWMELSQEIHGFLNGITLAEMKSRNDVVDVVKRQEGQVTGTDGSPIGSIVVES
ncbi:MAG: Fe-S cluster assembly transcriptional regulator IscR [endosymbiont of Galathealinum brachiosum]|uniref:Fe-S cluster assembly transcriptional regulator IscR n=1 Tax=endosymbiont of Galathealinum brachiosum TaxID=2200906 RepID=A0A370D679_9GAMM|nr:MAG: Fe-S cluster assembly transcriptional regulator IscR [endosymbiont of Galathealinum brachiosum]